MVLSEIIRSQSAFRWWQIFPDWRILVARLYILVAKSSLQTMERWRENIAVDGTGRILRSMG